MPTESKAMVSPASVVLGSPNELRHESEQHVSLCEALDRLLHKGAVLKGEITISIANVDLVYLGFHILLASVDTARRMMQPPEQVGPMTEGTS